MDPLSSSSVQRVQGALADAGSPARVIALAATARSAADAARSVGAPLGSIVKSLLFMLDDRPVMALFAGDRQCDLSRLAQLWGSAAKPRRATADEVRAATGFAIGGVAPVGHPGALPIAIDASLGRFDTVYAAAGHPHCVFPSSLTELERLTGGSVCDDISTPPPSP